MQIDDIVAEMEDELEWRLNEIKLLKNNITKIKKKDEKDRCRKALIVMLYSHFEGFYKTCLLIYINAINNLQILRREANINLATISMEHVLNQYDDINKKSKIFKKKFPDDSKLHKLARRVDLVNGFNMFLNEKLIIKDSVIEFDSNLNYNVLQKNLYKIGVNHDCFKKYQNDINTLVNYRNSIAHGQLRSGIEEKEYLNLENSVREVMKGVIRKLSQNLIEGAYKRAK
ncbi:MAE_28990/MAE_18760 family HEPN-like nuclease [Clostridium perfringens]|uniref:MAE_28990/MAE_18760 family HEPN-like nuclease n=1 Tax=Clostridium perfringens TaxID=1502 RepID=UPI0013E2F23A|nr:MAE_28990/MAE_18760 family HEPN-like nuclease [Clostridium perfringens]MDK0549804.1 MAE_28990/MAE_18760 family HEPN-like nuclease [Clostridium perfringens]MDK0552634.1 MAE_28990/MAE_18760 family HEPN-like nuclease [Clostridium perfringens]MDK0570828.1 MAE_28990/MAE_18760 family HEPN-like nuclease [Clostridium perfringens]MDK0833941.1 MAE_28990/MAE_18760 family HEPN-like nuclease [Clostridium perfringens]NGU11966.1 hypothetical protein [Clostridium perfringens]